MASVQDSSKGGAPAGSSREVRIGRGADGQFCTNEIKTSRYTSWNFLPKNLFEQFTRFGMLMFKDVCIETCRRVHNPAKF